MRGEAACASGLASVGRQGAQARRTIAEVAIVGTPVQGPDQEQHLVRLEPAPQGLQRERQAIGHRNRARQGLQDLSDGFQHAVTSSQVIEQPIALHRTGGIAGVQLDQV